MADGWTPCGCSRVSCRGLMRNHLAGRRIHSSTITSRQSVLRGTPQKANKIVEVSDTNIWCCFESAYCTTIFKTICWLKSELDQIWQCQQGCQMHLCTWIKGYCCFQATIFCHTGHTETCNASTVTKTIIKFGWRRFSHSWGLLASHPCLQFKNTPTAATATKHNNSISVDGICRQPRDLSVAGCHFCDWLVWEPTQPNGVVLFGEGGGRNCFPAHCFNQQQQPWWRIYPPYRAESLRSAEVLSVKKKEKKAGLYLQNERCDVWSRRAQIRYRLQFIMVQLSVHIEKENSEQDGSSCVGGRWRVFGKSCVYTGKLRTQGVLTFHWDAVVWKTKCSQAPAICYGSDPCEEKKWTKLKEKYTTRTAFLRCCRCLFASARQT